MTILNPDGNINRLRAHIRPARLRKKYNNNINLINNG